MSTSATELSIAERDFQPIPADQRQRPARVPSVSARLYVSKVQEHKEAFDFIKDMQEMHGEGTKTVVRALVHYEQTIIGTNGSFLNPEVALRAFRPLPREERPVKQQTKGLSARLYIDRWAEHRQAYEFIQRQQELHGDGAKTLVRALLNYRDAVIRPQQEAAAGPSQLSLDAPGLRPRR
jgi:hypothetical protein